MGTVQQQLSCALCQGNACMYIRSLFAPVKVVGKRLMTGLEMVVDEAGDV